MSPIIVLSAVLLIASSGTADAKRFSFGAAKRAAPPVRTTPASVPAVGVAPVIVIPAGTRARANEAASPAPASGQRPGQAAGAASSSVPLPVVQPVANPDARAPAVMGQSSGDQRPAKGFAMIN